MYCPVYGCNSDSKMTKEVRFFFQITRSSKQKKRHVLNSASAKHSNHCQTLEYAHFILPKTRLSQDSYHSFYNEYSAMKSLEYT